MTQTQRNELEKAIRRANRRGIVMVGRGTRKSDGARVYLVSSGSRQAATHWVIVSGGRLVCDCPARVVCCHRAIVHERLTAEANAARTAADEYARRRESAPLARSDAPLSIFR